MPEPLARLITVESGDHMPLGHGERIRAEIGEFLEQHIPGF